MNICFMFNTLHDFYWICVVYQCVVFTTCIFAGKFGLGVTHPFGALAVFFIASIFTIFVSVTSPAFRDAGSICDTVVFFSTALNHRWQHWNKSHLMMIASHIYSTHGQIHNSIELLFYKTSFTVYKYLSLQAGHLAAMIGQWDPKRKVISFLAFRFCVSKMFLSFLMTLCSLDLSPAGVPYI